MNYLLKKYEQHLESCRAENRILRDEIEKMEMAYNTLECNLQKRICELEEDLKDADGVFADLDVQYRDLQERYDSLEKDYDYLRGKEMN